VIGWGCGHRIRVELFREVCRDSNPLYQCRYIISSTRDSPLALRKSTYWNKNEIYDWVGIGVMVL
jgi:glucose-6-phosphate isomerase